MALGPAGAVTGAGYSKFRCYGMPGVRMRAKRSIDGHGWRTPDRVGRLWGLLLQRLQGVDIGFWAVTRAGRPKWCCGSLPRTVADPFGVLLKAMDMLLRPRKKKQCF